MNTIGNENLKNRLNRVFNKYSKKEALTYMKDDGTKEHYTFSNILIMIKNWENFFYCCGLQKGDRVAIIAPNMPKTIIAGLALAYSNITTVMIDATLPPEEINRLLAFSDVQGVFTVEKIYNQISKQLKDSIPFFNLERSTHSLVLFKGSAETVQCMPAEKRHEDVMVIIFSSGTTSAMKGVMLTYDSALLSRERFADFSGLNAQMSYLVVLPFNHISGYSSTFIFFLTGCTLGIIENVNSSKLQKGFLEFNPHCFGMIPKVFDIIADKIRQSIHEKGCIIESFINMMFKLSMFLRKHFGIKIGKYIFKPIYSKVFGNNIWGFAILGAVCKLETAEFYLSLGLEWANFYASTETNAPIMSTGIYDRYPKNSVGKIHSLKGIDIKINNPNNDGIGEIYVKTQLVMKGYFRDPELTAAAFDNGYFKTGDLGYLDDQDYLYIVGRIKETIILHNGKKVSAADIDNFYQKICPNVMLASCGVQNEEGYDEVYLFVEKQNLSETAIKNNLQKLLQKSLQTNSLYKIKQIYTIDKIPVTSVGKVKRYLLKEFVQNNTCNKSADIIETAIDDNKSNEEIVIDIIKSFHFAGEIHIDKSTKLVEDLQFDSLSVFELCVTLDEKFDVAIESSLHDKMTVGDIIQCIEHDNIYSQVTYNDSDNYPLPRTEKNFKDFNRFISLSKKLWNFKVFGQENLDLNEKYIFCPNHESYFDGMWIIGSLDDKISRSICSLAADWLFEHRIYRYALVMLGGIPVHRTGNTTTAMKRAYECLASENYNLLIHLEGTRTRSGKLGEFKSGAAKLSIETGIKIIPVCINGAYEIFPPHRKLPRLFDWKHFRKLPLQIQFGKPISPEDKTVDEITNDIRRQIVSMKNK